MGQEPLGASLHLPGTGRASILSGGHGAGKNLLPWQPRQSQASERLLRSPPQPHTCRRGLGRGRGAALAGGTDRERILPTAPRSRTNMKCSSIGASKSAPAAGSGRGWRQLPCRAVRSAPPLPELQERGFIKRGGKKNKKRWRNKKSPAHTLLSRKEIKCLGGGGGVEERGRAAAAQPGAGREGVKKGEAEHPGGRAAARPGRGRPWGQGMGSCLARGTKGWGLQGWTQQCQGSGLEGQSWLLGCGSSITLKWQPSDTVTTHGPVGDVLIQC